MAGSDIRRWTSLIIHCARGGCYQQTLHLFRQMLQHHLKHTKYVLPSVLRACANTQNLKTGKELHDHILRSLGCSDSFIETSLMDFYAKCGRINLARRLFDEMPHRDLVTWNTMVSGYANQGFVKNALLLVEEMTWVGVKPDLVTWNALLAGFAEVGDSVMALNLFEAMRNSGIDPDVVSWTSLVSGFVKSLRYSDALHMFRRMVLEGMKPSSVTISCLLPVCADVTNLKFGKEIHGYAVVVGFERDVFVSSSLVDMYAKCGSISEAEALFYTMDNRNVVSYNAMIFGYANHGKYDRAMGLFDEMIERADVLPDYLTFMAIVMTCGHAGWVTLGKKLFNLMQEGYGIKPRLEHYACMVDLLGRAGRISEACEFIKRMPVKPDSFVWGALLAACHCHGNAELAESTALHLFELEAESAGTPVLLANMFADSGRWKDSAKMKRLVKRKRLWRNKGCSWVEVT